MHKVTKGHLNKDKKEAKTMYKAAEKIEKGAKKMMARDKKTKPCK